MKKTSSTEMVRIAKFLAAGGFNLSAGYFIFFVFSELVGVHYLVAYSLAVFIWTGVGYEIQRRWVFRARPSKKALVRYLTPQLLLWVLGLGGFSLGVEILGLSAQLTYFLNLALLSVALYLYSRFFVFSGERNGKSKVPIFQKFVD